MKKPCLDFKMNLVLDSPQEAEGILCQQTLACDLPFLVDFQGKSAEKFAYGDHMVAEHLANCCKYELVAKNPDHNPVTTGVLQQL